MKPRIPSSTYRLQLHRDFTFADATGLLDYLHDLGISDCYISPLAQARSGSIHCYDVTDHGVVNPEIGGEEKFHQFALLAKRLGMGIIVDMVPNHMCIADTANRWWFDVLENGPSSHYAAFFDIDWRPPKADLASKVLLPILGDQYGRVLENQEITVFYEDGAFVAHYYQFVLPIAPRTWQWILEPAARTLQLRQGESHADVLELESIITALHHLPRRTETDPARVRERQREKEVIKGRLAALVEQRPEVREAITRSLTELNGVKGEPLSFDRLERLLADQAYRLSFWHVAADEINYRRFFDVNDLAAIRVEQPDVFASVHELIFRLLREGLVTGLRIDHVDGLLDPGQYLRLLQTQAALNDGGCTAGAADGGAATVASAALALASGDDPRGAARPLYVVVEKILGTDEALRSDWPVYGTTGYEFLNDLNGLFVEAANRMDFVDLYARFTGSRNSFRDIVYEAKKLVLRALMSGEQNVLARRLDRISEQHRWSRDFTLNSLGRVLAEVIACFPVYRSYVSGTATLSDDDRRYIVTAIERANRRNAALSEATFDFLGNVLLLVAPEGLNESARHERLDFTLRFQQLTSPVMAKGFEDTALYRYYPLASLNEVGGDPTAFGLDTSRFHDRNRKRLAEWPHALSATATHDTKRGEDMRARLNVLSEIPAQWERVISRWHEFNAPAMIELDGTPVPDPNEEYLLYQTLAGTWPTTPMTPERHAEFVDRITAYMEKATKEAKLRTSWVRPNLRHDRALAEFVATLMLPDAENRFLEEFRVFMKPLARAGMLNSLSQTLVKITAPGVPDFYQGTELWDLSLVDPDNRRPVDFGARRAILAELRRSTASDRLKLAHELFAHPEDGRVKLMLINRALDLRQSHAQLFAAGDYVALEVSGARSHHVAAFARVLGDEQVIVVAGRFFMQLGEAAPAAVRDPATWSDTFVEIPAALARARYVDAFTGCEIAPQEHGGRDTRVIALSALFAHMTVALLAPTD